MINFYNNIANVDINSHTMKFGERVELLIEKKGISKLWLAEQLGITKQALNYLLKHSSKPKYVDSLAEIMGANPIWLESGVGAPFYEIERKNIFFSQLAIHNSISLLESLNKNKQLSYENDLIEYIDYEHSTIENLIAYRIENDSISPPFIANTILIFDKTKTPSNGDYVLIIVNETQSVIVRQYSKDGNDIYYHSKNENYKSLVNINVSILGVLIEARYKIQQQ